MRQTDSVRQIKGVGEKAEKCLAKLGIYTVGDLLHHIPRSYDEYKPISPIENVREGDGMVAIEGVLTARPELKKRGHLQILTINIADHTGSIQVTWFNMAFLRNQLRLGTRYILRGKVERRYGTLQMQQPKILSKQEFYRKLGTLQPIYPLTKGLTNHAITKAISLALKETTELMDPLPSDILKRQGLISYKKALRQIHFPADKTSYREARKRLVFDEFYNYMLALQKIKKAGRKPSHYMLQKRADVAKLIENLPYALTKAQRRVWSEVEADLASGTIMQRLIQGDVGSGKTIIAILALYQAVLDHKQGALMVPTEVLATQHYKNVSDVLSPLGVRICLLTGSMTPKEKREMKDKIASRQIDVVIGTHAIIQESVAYSDLALVITDEQHRFGVRQRQTLADKGDAPHILAMSATPIPRTLALILYGDMDLSVIDERPADRLPVKNCVVNTDYRPNAYRFMKNQIDEGHQVYIICPMVDEGDNEELENVTIYTEELRTIFPSDVCIESLHGKMSPKDKDEILMRFAGGEIHILVSTTVIEVGIDVANATVMMVENAERFGLATLHQLRGRVGRGQWQSYCILMTGHESEESRERLDILAHSNDGFHIASEDLKMRGQGDLFGVRQSGDQLFKIADVYEDADVLRAVAEEVSCLT